MSRRTLFSALLSTVLLVLVVLAVVSYEEDPNLPPSSSSSPSPRIPPPVPVSPNPSKNPSKKNPGSREVAGVAMTALPDRARVICGTGRLEGSCPEFIPAEPKDGRFLFDAFGRPNGKFHVLEIVVGAPSDRDPARNRPPDVVHVVVEVAKPGFLVDYGDPIAGSTPLEALVEQRRDQAMIIGGYELGDVILAPSFPAGGAHADHLVYRWMQGGYEHRLSLHVWTPVTEPVKVLRAMAASIHD
ncbi:MAG: hypothetical protein M3280_10555 [Actinomycetota bacterium]|nr:hypothetical protein [Actinomycetota bacterium]